MSWIGRPQGSPPLRTSGGGGRSRLGLPLRRAGILALGSDVAVDELDHRHRRRIAVTEAGLEHARVAAVALLVARTEHLEELLDHGDVADFRDRLAACVQVAA